MDGVSARGLNEQAAGERGHLGEAEFETGRDPEVAAAATDRPEQVGLVVGIDRHDGAVGEDELSREQRIDRQAELPDEGAAATAAGDPAEPDGAGVAESDGEAVLTDDLRELDRSQARI